VALSSLTHALVWYVVGCCQGLGSWGLVGSDKIIGTGLIIVGGIVIVSFNIIGSVIIVGFVVGAFNDVNGVYVECPIDGGVVSGLAGAK